MNGSHNINFNGILSGYIYNTSTQIEKCGLQLFDEVKFDKDVLKTHWESYLFFSKEALAGEEIANNNGEFCYPILCCRAQNRVIILSKNKKIVSYLISKLNQYKNTQFSNTYVSVDQLIHHFFKFSQDYIITLINANYTGHGNALDYVVLSGNNISEADIFIKYIDTFNIFRCGLRLYDSREDLLKISNNGSISFTFNYNSTEILQQIDTFLSYIKELNLLR